MVFKRGGTIASMNWQIPRTHGYRIKSRLRG